MYKIIGGQFNMMMNIFAGGLVVIALAMVGLVWWIDNHGSRNQKDSSEKKK